MVKIILNSFLFWGGWIIIPFIMEIVPALGSVFLLIRRNLRHKIHKKELEVYPEITLIIPVYNSADTLYGCIRSINDSTYPNDRIRIFLVNNKGKDNSFDILKINKILKPLKNMKIINNRVYKKTKDEGVL